MPPNGISARGIPFLDKIIALTFYNPSIHYTLKPKKALL